MAGRPRASNKSTENELDKVEKQFDQFNEEVKAMTHDRLNETPKTEEEQQTKLSQKEIEKSKEIYLKPKRTLDAIDKNTGKAQVFNEKFRKQYEYDKEYVPFIAENKEIVGDTINLWTRPFGGMPAEEWEVPTNKPVWGPRYLAEQIKRKFYHRLVMQDRPVAHEGMGTYYGSMSIDTTVQRLDAHPVSQRKSIFMGSGAF